MKRLFVVLVLLIGYGGLNAQQENQKKYDSIWEGKLKINPALSLKVILKVVKGNDGTLTGFLDSPDQGAKDIPASEILVTEDSLKFKVNSLGATYESKIIKDSSKTSGTFKQGGGSFELSLVKVDKVAEVKRPQVPVKPYPYNEEELTFENKDAGVTLAGTLTYPKGEGKYPAVVLVTGSGGQDRDETVFNHKPFLVISDYLTRNGVAVLRFDDRGIAKSTGSQSVATSVDFAGDALAAVKYLKTRNEINVKHIGIMGHSEGGLIAPMAASNSNDVSFIVMLAGPGVPGDQIIIRQTALILKAEGTPEEKITKSVEESTRAFKIINSAPDSLTAYNELKKMFDDDIAKMSDDEKNKPENSEANFKKQVNTLLSPWFRFFLKYDPKPALESLTIPVLALNGEKDLQVDPEQNLPVIEKVLKQDGNKYSKVMKLADLNHMFQHAKTGAVSEYALSEETISPEALKIIGDWIKEVTK